MPGKKASTNADFKKVVTSFLEHDGNFDRVPAALKRNFVCQIYLDNPQLVVQDETHFLGAYLTAESFAAFRKAHKALKLTQSAGDKFLVDDWSLELVKVDSEKVFTSYADREVRLIVNSIKPSAGSNFTPNSYVENIHRDNDVKLLIAKATHEEIQEATELFDFGDLSRFEDKKGGNVKSQVRDVAVSDEEYTAVVSMKDMLRKEQPGQKLTVYEPIDEPSSFTKKRERKEERKGGKLKSRRPTEIKRAVEKIIRYKAGGKKSAGRASRKKTPAGKATGKQSSKRSTKKKGMTITAFRDYIGWYDQQSKAGKLSLATKKGTPKRSTSKASAKRSRKS